MTAHETFNNRLVLTRDFISRPVGKPCSREPDGTHLPVAYPETEVLRETTPAMHKTRLSGFIPVFSLQTLTATLDQF